MPNQTILVLLSGALWNDSRVLRISKTLSKDYAVTVLAYMGKPSNISAPFKVHEMKKGVGLSNKILSRSYFWLPFHRDVHTQFDLSKNYDLIWANDLNTLYTGAFLAKKMNAKLIYDSHEIYVETINQFFPTNTTGLKKAFHKWNCKLMQSLGKRMEAKYSMQASHIFTANESFSEILKEKYHWKRVTSLYNLPVYQESSNRSLKQNIRDTFTPNEIIVLYHGMFNAGRGLHLVIQAMQYLKLDYKLVMLGSGFLKAELTDFAKKLNVTNRVVFMEMVPEAELIGFIKGADVGINLLEKVNISKWNASPNKLFQYIHAGIPVVCSKSPENIKAFEKYAMGELVNNTPESIATGIEAINNNLQAKSGLGAAAKYFSWDSEEKKLLAIMGSIF